MINLPIKFHDKATQPPSANGTGYPHRISANDLDRNFAYAALDAGEGWTESVSVGNHEGRKLKLPELPSGGTYVLGCVDGTVKWIETESCDESTSG
jgi:hypothetical protein